MSPQASMNAIVNDAASREYLVFSLGEEEYAVDILKVQEIRGYENVTRIANVPDFIKGVTNLRGVIVPIIDLRLKFHLDKVEYDGQTVVIVVNVDDRIVGIVVDGVSDVMSLAPDQTGARVRRHAVVGLPERYRQSGRSHAGAGRYRETAHP